MKKVLFWGAGNDLRRFLKKKSTMPRIFDDVSIMITDSDKSKWEQVFEGITILKPMDAIRNYDGNVIITSKKYYNDIKDTVIQFGIDDNRINSLGCYIRDKIINKQYEINRTLNNENGCSPSSKYDINKLVVYTCIIGDYDELKIPKVVEEGIDYMCFTDQDIASPEVWKLVKIENDRYSPQEIVKMYKMLPHRFFPDYSTSIWIDASFTITAPLKELLKRYQENSDILMFPHPERVCLYSEAACCIYYELGEKDKILEQINRYYNEGISENTGLYSGGFIVRNHMVDYVIDAMEEWYGETMRSSSRDQISLTYIRQKQNFAVDLCNLDIFHNEYMEFLNHKVRR